MALESGYDAALMAPTEILAEQHFTNFKRWLDPLGVAVELQTGSRKTEAGRTPEARRPKAEVRSGERGAEDAQAVRVGLH